MQRSEFVNHLCKPPSESFSIRSLEVFAAVRPHRHLAESLVPGKGPILRIREATGRMPRQKLLDNNLIERYRLLGDLGFARTDAAIRKRSKNVNHMRLEIGVLPLEAENFADALVDGYGIHDYPR